QKPKDTRTLSNKQNQQKSKDTKGSSNKQKCNYCSYYKNSGHNIVIYPEK
ncbi:3945_t:CDS:1, partial [Scutellospora calospora]